MASTGFILCGSAADRGGGDASWSSLGNIYDGDDATYASCAVSHGDASNIVEGNTFSASVPSGSVIDGIEVRFRVSASASGHKVYLVQLVVGGTATGTDKANLASWSGSGTNLTYGGATDKWGLTPSQAQVIANNFGFVVKSIDDDSGGETVRLHAMWVNIHYTAAPDSEADGSVTTGPMEASGSVTREIPSYGEVTAEGMLADGSVFRTLEATGSLVLEPQLSDGSARSNHTYMSIELFVPILGIEGLALITIDCTGALELPPMEVDNNKHFAFGTIENPGIVSDTGTAKRKVKKVAHHTVLPGFQAEGHGGKLRQASGALALPSMTSEGFIGFVLITDGDGPIPPMQLALVMKSHRTFSGAASAPAFSVTATVISEAFDANTHTASGAITLSSQSSSSFSARTIEATGEPTLLALQSSGIAGFVGLAEAVGELVCMAFNSEGIVDYSTIVSVEGEVNLLALFSAGDAENSEPVVVTHTLSAGLELPALSSASAAFRTIESVGELTTSLFDSGANADNSSLLDVEAELVLIPQEISGSASRTVLCSGEVTMELPTFEIGSRIFRVADDVELPGMVMDGLFSVKRFASGELNIVAMESSSEVDLRKPADASSPARVPIAATEVSGMFSRTIKATGELSLQMLEFEYSQLVARKFDFEIILPGLDAYGFSEQEVSNTQIYVVTKIERVQGSINKRVYLQALEAPVLR